MQLRARLAAGLVPWACVVACSPATTSGELPARSPSVESAAPELLPGRDMALHSTGAPRDAAWQLDENGFVASYLSVGESGPVELTVEASGQAGAGQRPRMRLVVADHVHEFDVASERTPYQVSLTLPAGTYLARVDFVNDRPDAARNLVVHQLAVHGARLVPGHTDRNALDAANTYIRHYRRGPAKVSLPGVAPGTLVRVQLVRHTFGFGANIPFAENKLIPESVTPGSDAEQFQRLFLGHFNTGVLSNGGKWVYHEPVRDQVQIDYVDRFLDFAEQHALRARMHTLIWDTEQQPAWVVSQDPKEPGLLTRAHAGDEAARAELWAEIEERIDYYVRERARRYHELDVLNESLHRPRYYQVLGDQGLAELFRKTAGAVREAGGSTRLYLNEYNLLQWSTDPLASDAGPDPYANWYRRHAEAVLRAGGPIDGLGVQYYADGRLENEIQGNAHSAARIMGVLQNLAGTGLRLTLTEFAVNPGELPPERAADILEQTLRLVFGNPQMDGFLMWATWAHAAQNPPPLSILMDAQNQLTPAGRRYEALMREWNTQLELPVAADGSIEFEGFFGDYSLRTSDGVRCLGLTKGRADYRVEKVAPPTLSDRRACASVR